MEIYDNSATEYGGGAYLTFDQPDDVGFEPDNNSDEPQIQN